MNDLQIKAVIVGLSFAIWPLVMNKSGLNGYVAAAFYTLVGLLVMIPFAVSNLSGPTTQAGWVFAVVAALIGAAGVITMNNMLSKATPQNIGSLLITLFIVQLAVPAIYQIIKGGQMNVSRGIGLVAAFAAAVLLNR